MFVLVSASGLMVTAQIAMIAKDYGVAQTVILFGGTTLIVAGIIDNLANGGARPFFGWVSDQIGREYTMAIAFTAGGIAYWLLGAAGTTPWTFVICAALIFFTWGEIFSLFPSTCTDMFGPKYATTNTALLYTAKGLSAFVVPLANVLKSHTGSWHSVFLRRRDHEFHRGRYWRCSWFGRCGLRSARRRTRAPWDSRPSENQGRLASGSRGAAQAALFFLALGQLPRTVRSRNDSSPAMHSRSR